jgi:hypothetical protein
LPELIELARFAIDGAWPDARGTFYQTTSFLELVRIVKSEDLHWKARYSTPS